MPAPRFHLRPAGPQTACYVEGPDTCRFLGSGSGVLALVRLLVGSGTAPSADELADAIGVKRAVVDKALTQLAAAGAVHRYLGSRYWVPGKEREPKAAKRQEVAA